MIIIPYRVDVPYDRRPVTNWLLAFSLVVVFAFQYIEARNNPCTVEIVEPNNQQAGNEEMPTFRLERPERVSDQFVLSRWGLKGLIGHMWLHGGIIHLVGNLIFLWAFGNSICAKLSNIIYFPVYLFLGLASAASHLIFTGGAAIGASGAINGLVGMYLIFFPRNDMDCLFILFIPLMVRPIIKKFTVSGYWMILMWFVFDVWGTVRGGGGVAYSAHLGGFVTGAVLAIILLETKLIRMESYEQSLLDVFERKEKEQDVFDRNSLGFWQQEAELSSAADAEAPAGSTKLPMPTQEPPPPASLFLKEQQPEQLIRFFCPCGKRLKAPQRYAGKAAKCTKCGKPVRIPAESQLRSQQESYPSGQEQASVIRFACSCGKRFKVPAEWGGRTARCPQCHKRIKIPEKPLL